jgi:predicted DNA binding CopG/RHH family protein
MDKEKEKKINQFTYQNNYNKEKYDRIGLMTPKGKKEKIKKKAAEKGMSVNEYINSLINADMAGDVTAEEA